MADGTGGIGPEFTLGTVVGEIRALSGQIQRMEDRLDDRIDEVKTDFNARIVDVRTDLQKQADSHDTRLGRQERNSGNWRWLERAGAVLGGIIGGFFSGKLGH